MIVFKTFFRLLKKNSGNIILPIVIFVLLSLGINLQSRSTSAEFEKIKAVVVLINRGEETPITEGLRSYIEDTMTLLPLDEKFIDDAIFYRQADFIAIIEADGSMNFEMIYDANFAYLAKDSINQFLNDVELYRKYQPNLSEETIVNRVLLDANDKTIIHSLDKQGDQTAFVSTYFNALVYITMMIILGVLGKIFLIFNQPIIRFRSDVSALSPKKRGTQLFVSAILTMHVLWLIMSCVTLVIIHDKIGQTNVVPFFFVMYLFSWCTLALSFLISRIISSDNALTAFTTGLSLGLAFISGVFVPQEVLSPFILSIAKVSPAYWTVIINNRLRMGENLSEMLVPIAILIMFALVFVSIGLLISRQKKVKALNLA